MLWALKLFCLENLHHLLPIDGLEQIFRASTRRLRVSHRWYRLEWYRKMLRQLQTLWGFKCARQYSPTRVKSNVTVGHAFDWDLLTSGLRQFNKATSMKRLTVWKTAHVDIKGIMTVGDIIYLGLWLGSLLHHSCVPSPLDISSATVGVPPMC